MLPSCDFSYAFEYPHHDMVFSFPRFFIVLVVLALYYSIAFYLTCNRKSVCPSCVVLYHAVLYLEPLTKSVV